MTPDPTPTLMDRLALIFEWYEGMVCPESGLLPYSYDPERDMAIANGNAIRNIASIWNVEVLSEFLQRSELRSVTERSLARYLGWLVEHDGTLLVDPRRLHGPSSIAHSAFMLLSLLHARSAEHAPRVRGLADAILAQQRSDGSYGIQFGGQSDDGVEFYAGEAMLALLETYQFTRDARYLRSAERAFAYYRARLSTATLDSSLLVFCANWQSQAGALLFENTHSHRLREEIRDYLFGLHDRIAAEGFYADIEHHPSRQATVAVACALEGLADVRKTAVLAGDPRRATRYACCAGTALGFLCRAQRISDCAPRERGGFGHSLLDRTQRIDVTGHVAAGFMKAACNDRAPHASCRRGMRLAF